ncbi:MAG: acyltransferase family protein [Verrucomicrobiales bacterium]
MGQENKKTFASLQIFRGIAAILVVLFHTDTFARLPNYFDTKFLGGAFSWGGAGVDFFFVLSGFLIFLMHHGDIGRPERFKPYIIKRILRIYPVYWVVTLCVIPVYFLSPSFGLEKDRDPFVILGSLALLPVPQGHTLRVAWTLVYEVAFYIAFGLAILTSRRAAVAGIALWLVGILLLRFTSIYLLLDVSTQMVIDSFFSERIVEFLFGCFAAILYLKGSRTGAGLFFPLGVFLFAGSIIFLKFSEATSILGIGLGASFICLSGVLHDEFWHRMPGVKFWMFLGDASYSIYLAHFSALSVLMKLGLKFGNLLPVQVVFCMAAILATVCGCLLHVVIEKPLLAFLRRRFLPSRRELPRSVGSSHYSGVAQ